jgi:thiosulfate dehydrogenase [quinone] large subunit
MQALKRFFTIPGILAAFVGFLVLFSACAAGYDYFTAGREKAGAAVWTGSQAGTGIAGFIKGAEAKAVKSPQNPNPEVLPAQHSLNRLYLQHTKIFSYMVVLGEILMPLGVLFFLVVKFPASRFFLMTIAGLAAFMNLTYLAEGTSSTNPPMVFMWLTIIWTAALIPGAALFYAIDVRKLFGKQVDETATMPVVSVGQWLIFAVMFAVTFIAAVLMYPVTEVLVILAVAAAIAAALSGINLLLARRQEHKVPARVGMIPGATPA